MSRGPVRFGARLFAQCVDWGLFLFVVLPAGWQVALRWEGAGGRAEWAALLWAVVWTLVSAPLMFGILNATGGTPGKRLVGAVVVARSDWSRPAGVIRSVWREVVRLVSFVPALLPVTLIMRAAGGEWFHDLLSGTQVVRRTVLQPRAARRAGGVSAAGPAVSSGEVGDGGVATGWEHLLNSEQGGGSGA